WLRLGLLSISTLLLTARPSQLGAQTPPSVSITPSSGTHVTSGTVEVIVNACSDNDLQDPGSITVNGSTYGALRSGGGGGQFGCTYSGGWGAFVPLDPGANSVSAEVCDVNDNCESASTTVFYDVYDLSVSGGTSPLPIQEVTSGSASFTINNTGSMDGTLQITV